MKRDLKNQKKPLRVHSETIRKLSLSQLMEVAGGITTSVKQTLCDILCVR